jgi:hypothetical protein
VPSRRMSPAQAPRVSRVVTPNPQGRHFTGGSGGTGAQSKGYRARSVRDVAAVGAASEQYGATRGDLKGISAAAPRLFAQFLICGVFVSASVLTEHQTYLDRMSEVLWRLTAITALYFILALVSMNKTMSEVAVQFGWLIVGVVFLKSVSNIGQVFNALAGAGTGLSDADLTSDNTTDQPPHEYLQ